VGLDRDLDRDPDPDPDPDREAAETPRERALVRLTGRASVI
jgi:hypothetical protein